MTERTDASRDAVRKTGRAFLLAGGFLGALLFLGHSHVGGWWAWNWRAGFETDGWKWLVGSGLVLFAASYVCYPVMKPVHIGWMNAARIWGWISTRTVLCIFFFGILTPMGWVSRMLGKDLLDEKAGPETASYWKQRAKPLDPRGMERQF